MPKKKRARFSALALVKKWKKISIWKQYETLWVVLFSIITVALVAGVLRSLTSVQQDAEQVYIGMESYSTYELDFFVAQNNTETTKKSTEHPLSLLNYFDDLNPFTTTQALAQAPSDAPQEAPTIDGHVYLETITEPNIRVGLTFELNPLMISYNSPYQVQDESGAVLTTVPANTPVTISYDKWTEEYLIQNNETEITSTSYLQIVPTQKNAIATLENYTNRPTWNQGLNDNEFRGTFEYRYTPATDRIWTINEVAMSDYLKGLGETTSFAPLEYLQVITVAARSYALWHHLDGTKHASEYFAVRATTIDQVYNGYGIEKRHPGLVEAVANTTGLVATYKNELAIIPYFSGSNGRTYSWQTVWGSSKYPWVIGVAVPEERGLPLLGHGVGLSQRGARYMVDAGASMSEVYAHFFPSVLLQNIY